MGNALLTSKEDTCVTLVPYFKVKPGMMKEFKDKQIPLFFSKTEAEFKAGCLFYAFTVKDDIVMCREGYVDAEAVLTHVGNVTEALGEAAKLADVVKCEVHGPASEVAKLKEPLKDFNAEYFELLPGGFRK